MAAGVVLDETMPEKVMRQAAVRQFIDDRYAAVHGACAKSDYPHYCAVQPMSADQPRAALGFRLASEGPLFLETYLDVPVESAVEVGFGQKFERSRIVEIGSHASDLSKATVALWARTARYLDGLADVAVAVLTNDMARMLQRLGIDIVELAEADPARLRRDGDGWGRYYETSPRVFAGLISPARPRLAGFDDGMLSICS